MKGGSKARVTPRLLGVLTAVCVAGVFVFVPPLAQDPAFHRFADRRAVLGVTNALDVLSNLPFVVVGLLGLAAARARDSVFGEDWERVPWQILFGAVAVTAFGSGWYHLVPSDASLFWDRLPQTLITMALLTAVIAERIAVPVARRALWPLLGLGAVSVAVWMGTGDLRLYGVVQFLPTALIPLLLVVNPPRYTRGLDLWIALGWYVIARLCEFLDYELFGELGVSGHTLKHVAAAASVLWLARMIRRRSFAQPPATTDQPLVR